MVIAEDKTGSGWISRITGLVKKKPELKINKPNPVNETVNNGVAGREKIDPEPK